MTSHMTFFELNSTCGVESIKHLFEISLKAELYGVPNIYSFITSPITCLLLFTLNIPPNQLSKVVSTRLAVNNKDIGQ